jgi:hypothetical protein
MFVFTSEMKSSVSISFVYDLNLFHNYHNKNGRYTNKLLLHELVEDFLEKSAGSE